MGTPPANPPDKLSLFQLALLVLSIVVLIALLVEALVPLHEEVSLIVQTLDLVVCALFFMDFVFRFRRAPDKAAFLRWGWIDLIACIPTIDALRVGVFLRILRIVRLLQGGRVPGKVVSLILQNKPKSAFASAALATLLLITFASIAILTVEKTPHANIRTAEDAIWWSVTTMTTVGYGDKYPVTTPGRVVAVVLMFSGVGLFGTLSGLLASLFFGQRDDKFEEIKAAIERLEASNRKAGEGENRRKV